MPQINKEIQNNTDVKASEECIQIIPLIRTTGANSYNLLHILLVMQQNVLA